MNDRIDRIKDHIRENKKLYLVGATGIVVGASGAALMLNSKSIINARQLQILAWKSKQTVEVYVEALGDPGNIIQDTTTGIIYASQGQAARELGITPSAVSQQLRGKKPHVRGHAFTILGKAAVPTE